LIVEEALYLKNYYDNLIVSGFTKPRKVFAVKKDCCWSKFKEENHKQHGKGKAALLIFGLFLTVWYHL
jgi:hypothetical protein